MEAVCPTSGKGVNRVLDSFVSCEHGVVDSPDQEILKRINSVIDAKIKVYKDIYIPSGLVKSDGYLVIAVNTFLLGPFSQHGISGFPSVLSAVYPVGPGTVEINIASGKFLDRGLKYQPAIFKVNGASIRTDLFSRDNGTIIDAIMTGHVHLYQNSTERKLLAIHNHYSKNELKYRLPVDCNYWLERNNAMTLSIKKG